MTDISISRYVDKALQSGDGVIRTTANDGGELVNKGALGHKLATLFGWGDVNSRSDREKTALEGFKKALTDQYGETIANDALKKAGIDENTIQLTGDMVLTAAKDARSIIGDAKLENRAVLRDFTLVGGPGGTHTNLTNLTEPAREEYIARFTERFAALANGGQHVVSREEATQVGMSILRELSDLNGAQGAITDEKLMEMTQSRRALEASVADVLLAIANRAGPDVVLDRMNKVEERLVALEKAQNPSEEQGENAPFQRFDDKKRHEVMNMAIRNGMTKVQTEDRYHPQLERVQNRTLQDDNSSLRALYSGAKEMAVYGTDEQKQEGQRIMKLCDGLVSGLASKLLPVSDSYGKDLERLHDGTTVRPETLETGRALLIAKNGDFGPADEVFLRKLKQDPDLQGIHKSSSNTSLDTPKWHSSQVLAALEESVSMYTEQFGDLPYEACLDKFREAITGDQSLHPGLQAKLLAGLDALGAEHRVHERFARSAAFAGLSRDNLWQLCAPGAWVDNDPPVVKWDLEHRSEGSLAGLYRGLEAMLDGQENRIPLTAEHLESLHRISTENSFKSELLEISYSIGMEDQVSAYHEGSALPMNFRVADTNLNMDLNGQTTEKGRAELNDYVTRNPDWFGPPQGKVIERAIEGKPGLELNLPGVNEGSAKTRTDKILNNHYVNINNVGNDDQKRMIIADTVQQLYRSHLFEDGNTRTMVYSTMNRLLLDNGLSPAILREPKAAAGFSLEEFSNEIKIGQQRFQALINPGIEPEEIRNRQLPVDEIIRTVQEEDKDNDAIDDLAVIDAPQGNFPPKEIPPSIQPFFDGLIRDFPGIRQDDIDTWRLADLQRAVIARVDDLVSQGQSLQEVSNLIRQAVTDNPLIERQAEDDILGALRQAANR